MKQKQLPEFLEAPSLRMARNYSAPHVMVCPVCGQNDVIAKVSAIYESGVSYSQHDLPVMGARTQIGGYYSPDNGGMQPFAMMSNQVVGTRTVTRSNQTALSGRFSPPTVAAYPESVPLSSIGKGKLAAIFGAVSVTCLVIVVLSFPLKAPTPMVCVLAALFGIPSTIALLYAATKDAKKIEQQNRLRNQELNRVYLQAYDQWNSAYYCHRDGIAFDSRSGRVISNM